MKQSQSQAGFGKPTPPKTGATARVKLTPPRRATPAGLLEERTDDSQGHAVTFEYFNPAAREVLVAGCFNG
jgi:hypothetical protein